MHSMKAIVFNIESTGFDHFGAIYEKDQICKFRPKIIIQKHFCFAICDRSFPFWTCEEGGMI